MIQPQAESRTEVSRRFLPPERHRIDADLVTHRFEDAGRTLLSLPGGRCMPAGFGSGWPDIVRDAREAYGYQTNPHIRAPVPSAEAIDRMDATWTWVNLIPAHKPPGAPRGVYSSHGGAVLRRLLLLRALVSPITGKHLFSWRRIALEHSTDHTAIQRWHGQAVGMIVQGLHGR